MPVTIKNRWNGETIATVDDTDDLREAVIRLVKKGVDLRNASLDGASLRNASLDGASLDGASLDPIRNDFWAVLAYAPLEVPALITALDRGRVNGSTYSDGECGCLVGTLAIAGGANPQVGAECSVVHGLRGNGSRPAEVFFAAIKKGDTPETNQFSKMARGWAQDWHDRMTAAFRPADESRESTPAAVAQTAL